MEIFIHILLSGDSEKVPSTEFKRIAIPILEEKNESRDRISQLPVINCNLMDQPLSFSVNLRTDENINEKDVDSNEYISNFSTTKCNLGTLNENISAYPEGVQRDEQKYFTQKSNKEINYQLKKNITIVDYDSSDSESL